MGGEYLFSFAALGADVNYILTGQRTIIPESQQLAEQQRAGYGDHILSNDEKELLDNYSSCSEEGKNSIKTISASLAQSAKRMKQ